MNTDSMRAKQIPESQLKLESELRRSPCAGKITFLPPHAWTEYGLTIQVPAANVLEVMKSLRSEAAFDFTMLIDVTCVDWLDARDERFEIVYQLLSLSKKHRLCVKVPVPEQTPEVASVRPLWESAFFMEREVFDLFGVTFSGHGDMRRILMYDEFEGYPLRKDYPLRGKQPRVPLRVPELRNTSVDMERHRLVSLPKRSARAD